MRRVIDRLEAFAAEIDAHHYLLHHSPGFFVEASAKHIVYINSELEAFLGANWAGRLTADWMTQVVHPEDRERTIAYHAASHATGDATVAFRNRLVGAGGKVAEVDWLVQVDYPRDRSWAKGVSCACP